MSSTLQDQPIKTFPITVPLLGPAASQLFAPPRSEEWSREYWIGNSFPVQYSVSGLIHSEAALRQDPLPGIEWYRLLAEAEELAVQPWTSDELLAPRHLAHRWRSVGVVAYPHQLETARRVLFEMGGRAILADEVGLGKTIEAGIIVKEALLRGLAQRILILTPASLCWQWFHELKEKFNIACGIQRSQYDWERTPILIASLDKAKRDPHRRIIEDLEYDMLIVDEAHKLKNAGTQSYRFVSAIRRKYCLMLTATPMQNDLKELFNLINLIRPGQLGTYKEFKRTYVYDLRTPKQTEELKGLLQEVMVRNRRSANTVQFTDRHVHSIPITLSPQERELYEEVSAFVQNEYRQAVGSVRNVLPLITLQREVCSSSIAAALTLEKLQQRTSDPSARNRLQQLLELALAVQNNSKVDFLEELLRKTDEKVIVFTEYRATQEYIRWRLQQAGFSTLGFNGSLSASRKGWIRELFRTQCQVLVSTESGGEGLNFQFCRNVVNYDLPWNPMRIEQRIGRVHRLGQTQDVHIYNLATEQTIEEHILYLLYEKIDMFQMVMGEMDAILSHIRMKSSFESALTQILVGSQSTREMKYRLAELAQKIVEGREEAQASNTLDRLFTW